MQRYQVISPFKASVAGEIIVLEPGEIIPGPRVPEIESWGRSIHHLQNSHKIAPFMQVDAGELSDREIVDSRGDGLLEHFHEDTLREELERRGDDERGDRITVTQEMGLQIGEHGDPMVRQPHPVKVVLMDAPFRLETSRGIVDGQAGDFLAHDPVSGHTWPVTADYLEQHYEPETVDDETEAEAEGETDEAEASAVDPTTDPDAPGGDLTKKNRGALNEIAAALGIDQADSVELYATKKDLVDAIVAKQAEAQTG